jgi:hypothetical protein
MFETKKANLLSTEAAVTLVAGLIVGLIPEMPWWLRGIGVLGTTALALHTGKRIERGVWKIAFPAVSIAILIAGTWNSIWLGFHQAFPRITEEETLATIIEFFAVSASCLAGYVFLLRPRGKEGYKAQVMAFGACVAAFGFATIVIGLAWQFQQNWAAGIKPTGAPVFSLVPPQISQTTAPRALPPPQQQATLTPFFSNYNLTEDGVKALAGELYKIRDALAKRIDLARMSTDGSAGGFSGNFVRACDQAGVDCPIGNLHPNSPDEKGLMIYVADPDKPPAAAKELQDALLKLGIDVPFVPRLGFGPTGFILFVGPRPRRAMFPLASPGPIPMLRDTLERT